MPVLGSSGGTVPINGMVSFAQFSGVSGFANVITTDTGEVYLKTGLYETDTASYPDAATTLQPISIANTITLTSLPGCDPSTDALRDVALSSTHAYIIDYTTLKIYKLTKSLNPSIVANTSIQGTYTFGAYYGIAYNSSNNEVTAINSNGQFNKYDADLNYLSVEGLSSSTTYVWCMTYDDRSDTYVHAFMYNAGTTTFHTELKALESTSLSAANNSPTTDIPYGRFRGGSVAYYDNRYYVSGLPGLCQIFFDPRKAIFSNNPFRTIAEYNDVIPANPIINMEIAGGGIDTDGTYMWAVGSSASIVIYNMANVIGIGTPQYDNVAFPSQIIGTGNSSLRGNTEGYQVPMYIRIK